MMIFMNFIDDLDAMTIKCLEDFGYLRLQKDTAFERFAKLHMLTERTIPEIPYVVKFSKQLLENPKHQKLKSVLNEITLRLREGKSIAPYLSTKAIMPNHQDGLLTSWGIHHLHLSSIETKACNGFVSRPRGQSELLFLRIEGSTAYLIDIVSHSENYLFVNPRLLEIVDKNWPELHMASKEVSGECLSPDQIKNLRANGYNVMFSINDRNIFPTLGITSNGVPLRMQIQYRVLCDELQNVESDVRRRFYEYFPYRALPATSGPLIPEVRLVAIENEYFVLQEQATMRICHARRSLIN